MVNVGVIGLGMMGVTHLDALFKLPNAKVVAVGDRNQDKLDQSNTAKGNVPGQAQGSFSLDGVKKYKVPMELLSDPDVELVDICLPTPAHVEYALAALEAGKHVLVEKPLSLTSAEAFRLVDAAKRSKKFVMPAMCLRFWPVWKWLKNAVASEEYGKVLSATFRRIAAHPGGAFYMDGSKCGGGILDLHIHDVDFAYYLFGMPKSVTSFGYSRYTGQIDHVISRYEFADGALVTAEGGWTMSPGFPFRAEYIVNFQHATAVHDLSHPDPLVLYRPAQEPESILLPEGMGYAGEIAYFINCVEDGVPPSTVTLEDAANDLLIIEAERESIATGKPAIPKTR